MIESICKRAFFQFEFPIHYCAKPPRMTGTAAHWDARYQAPPLVELEEQEPFADVYWAWNNDGFFAAFDIPNRPGKPQSDPQKWWQKNGLRLCIDTRDTRDNKRATRFCHFFYLLPTGGGADGNAPIVGTHRMSRAKEPPPAIDTSLIRIASHLTRNGYSLEVALPSTCLDGWDPSEHPRIGIFYKVRDSHFGSQHLTVDDELGWNVDPSTWATGVLVR